MYSVTLLLAFIQLAAFAVGTAHVPSHDEAQPDVKRDGGLECRKAPQWSTWSAWSSATTSSKWSTVTVSTSKISTTLSIKTSTTLSTKISTTTSTTPSITPSTTPIATTTTTAGASSTVTASPNCPTTFQLYIFAGSFGNYYIIVNGTNEYVDTQTAATTFSLQNNRLITVDAPGGVASVPKGTTVNGATIISTLDTVNYDPLDALLYDQYNDGSCQIVFTKQISSTTSLNTLYAVNGALYVGSSDNPPPNGYEFNGSIRARTPAPVNK